MTLSTSSFFTSQLCSTLKHFDEVGRGFPVAREGHRGIGRHVEPGVGLITTQGADKSERIKSESALGAHDQSAAGAIGQIGRPTGPNANGGTVFQAQKASGHILDIVLANVVVSGRKHALWRAAVGQRRNHVFALVGQLGVRRARGGHHFGIAHNPQQGVERVDANVVERAAARGFFHVEAAPSGHATAAEGRGFSIVHLAQVPAVGQLLGSGIAAGETARLGDK